MDYPILLKQQSFLQLIMNNIPQFVFWKDINSVYLGCNQNFANAAGLASPSDIVGKTDYDLPWTKTEADFYIATDARVMAANQPEVDFEEPQTISDGTVTWLRTSKIPLNDENGKVIGILGTYEDITKKKEMELKLVNSSKALVKSNEKMKKIILELERLNMDMEQFAYATSHDLQEPLRIISNFSKLLEKELKEKFNEDAQQYFDFISSSIERMSKLTNGILTYLRLGKEEEEMSLADLNYIFQKVLNKKQISAFLKEKNANIQVNLPTKKLKVYPKQLNVLLYNLLNNALKFNTNNPVKITIDFEEKSTEWRFSVTDNGIGIDEAYSQLIYLPFKKLNAHKDFAGSGIGLSICKRIANLHAGKIWHEANPNGGTIFYFTIAK